MENNFNKYVKTYEYGKRDEDIFKLISAIYNIMKNTGVSLRMIKIRTIAEELGVPSTPPIDILDRYVKLDNVPTIELARQIRETENEHRLGLRHKRNSNGKSVSCGNDEIVESLKKQIAEKDKQIDLLTNQMNVYKNLYQESQEKNNNKSYVELIEKMFNVVNSMATSYQSFYDKYKELTNNKK